MAYFLGKYSKDYEKIFMIDHTELSKIYSAYNKIQNKECCLKSINKEKIKKDYFLEYTNYAGNYYGTPKDIIKEKVDQGIDVILEIEIEGAMKIKNLLPEALFIFIMPPSMKELVKRLKGRGTESNEKLLKRFHETYKEINEVTKYNYVVVNDEVELAADKIEAILKAEKCRVDRIEEVYLDNSEEAIHELLLDNKNFVNEDIKI